MREVVLRTPLGEVHGLRQGEAGQPRVLALHGWLDNAASFVPLASQLHGIDLVAIDLPGHGRSAHVPAGRGYAFALALHDVLDIADALGWERFSLLGHSMGAAISGMLAATCPGRIERAVLIEGLAPLPGDVERTVEKLREWLVLSRGVADRRLRVFEDLELAVRARMRGETGAIDAPSARLLVERGVREVVVDGVRKGWQWSSDPRLRLPTPLRMSMSQVRALLAGIECPARLIHATPGQPYLPEAEYRALAALIPHGERIALAGGHHLHMEQPQAVAAAIGDFLAPAR